MPDETRQSPAETVSHAACVDCGGAGYVFRLPPGANPFAASIFVTARKMRRIACHCQQLIKSHRPGAPVPAPQQEK